MGFFQTRDKLSLFYHRQAAFSPKASIVFLHGVGEHIGRYEPAFLAFAEQGYSCYGFDQRGFGRSEGKRGHVHIFQDYVDDVAEFLNQIVLKDAARPIFLFGHSMGSIIQLTYALHPEAAIQGLLIFSCPLQLASWFAGFSGVLAGILSTIAPQLRIPSLIDLAELTDDPRVIDNFEHDPYRLDTVTVGWLHQFTLARENIGRNAGRISLPALICHGGDDRIAAASGAQALYGRLGSGDKSLTVYAGFKHELLNHKPDESAKVLKDVFEWLDKQLAVMGKD
jgi:alpha-beta hydrolase superfamily lysophospholipase